jgi:hypothetical protein
MWHVKEFLLGQQELFELSLLYYPYGATLFTSVPGPLIGLMGLPFWVWGPEAAYNGAVLLGFIFSAYFMFRLARVWGIPLKPAFVAGLLFLMAPMHLAGMQGHITKVFIGLLPLALLCFRRSIDLDQPRFRATIWAGATTLVLLLTALFHGFQLILILMAIAYFSLSALLKVSRENRKHLTLRLASIAVLVGIVLGPYLIAVANVALDPRIPFGRNFESTTYQPDIVEFFLPSSTSRIMGAAALSFMQDRGVNPTIETEIALPWIALALSVIALLRVRRKAIVWILFSLGLMLLSLGPSLKLLGRTTFTEYGLPVILPYAFFTALPGMDFLRTPGRFMTMGYVGLSMTAAYGLHYLMQRFPRQARIIFFSVVLVILVGQWPRIWDQMELRPVPSFYESIAADPDEYGVLDLPIRPSSSYPADMYSAYYQMYQMTHGKGIATGYQPRSYGEHPVFPCLIPDMVETSDILLDGDPAQCYQNTLFDLARSNYRFVVYHKPQSLYDEYTPGSWAERQASEFIDRFFGDQEPLEEDDYARVFEVPDLDKIEIATMIRSGDNWYKIEFDGEEHWRWARSPAKLDITSEYSQKACLEITPFHIHDPASPGIFGDQGILTVTGDTGLNESIVIRPGKVTKIALDLEAGENIILLSLDAGNFQPGRFGGADTRWLSFAIQEINLQTGSRCDKQIVGS